MTFPGIYFKHNSTDYADMPYTVDSCLGYTATHIKDINDFVIWRDSLETEKLTNRRIKKLRKGSANICLSKKLKFTPWEKSKKSLDELSKWVLTMSELNIYFL